MTKASDVSLEQYQAAADRIHRGVARLGDRPLCLQYRPRIIKTSIRIVEYQGVWSVSCRGVMGVLRCSSREEANLHSLVASSFVWAFNKLRAR